MIYGYDDTDYTFLSAGFLADKHYRPYKISYHDYLNSILNTSFECINICLKTFCVEGKYFMSIEEIIEELQNYLCLETSGVSPKNATEVHGIVAIKKLSDFYFNSINNGEYFDLRYSKGLVDLKKILVEILKYIYSYYRIGVKNYIDLAEQVHYYTRLIHNLGIKYNITKKMKSIELLFECFQYIVDIELSYLPSVLHDLKALVPLAR